VVVPRRSGTHEIAAHLTQRPPVVVDWTIRPYTGKPIGEKMINKLKKKRNTLDETPCIVTVSGEPASKANSRRLVMIGGKPRFIKSKKALGYSSLFKTQIGCREQLMDFDLCVAMKIYYKTRRPDLDESLILDLLQDKIYQNDRQVKVKYIEWGLDKENPRAIIVCGPEDQRDSIIETLRKVVKEEP
jgi:Holliday junction resolvase RusA-like endonuclease